MLSLAFIYFQAAFQTTELQHKVGLSVNSQYRNISIMFVNTVYVLHIEFVMCMKMFKKSSINILEVDLQGISKSFFPDRHP